MRPCSSIGETYFHENISAQESASKRTQIKCLKAKNLRKLKYHNLRKLKFSFSLENIYVVSYKNFLSAF